MAGEEEKREEKPVLSRAKGTFEVVSVQGRKLLNGNKLRVIMEAEYTPELAGDMGPLFDKDCSVSFKELASKKRRERYGGEEGGQKTFDGGTEGEDPDATDTATETAAS